MESNDRYAPLVEWLREKAHSDKDIEQILARVRDYESQVQHDSLMDAIGDGSLDIDALVKEALGGE
jgi:hypothetical protein